MDNLTKTYDSLYRYCSYRVRDPSAAEDITQEAFLRYFAQNPRLGRGEEMAYLYVIARNLCTDHFRKRHPEALREDYPTADFADESSTSLAVRTALRRLESRQREVLLLRYLGGLSVNETAKALAVSRFAVYRLERLALAEMKKQLEGAV